MAILVTGGAGFIGSHISDRLIEMGEGVVVVDNLSTGRRENLNPEARLYEMDICSSSIENVFKENEINSVVHQAAQASVIKSVGDPNFDAKVNVKGSINLLECCRRYNVGKIVYASSAGIYGDPQYLPIDENHPILPLSPYGVSKYVAELYVSLYHRLHGLKYASLRYSNVYGPRQDPYGEAGVIAIFSSKILKNEGPVIFGDGEQTRDFIHVKDVVDANILALKKTSNSVYNISTGKQTSVNKIFELLRETSNRDIKPVHEDERKGEVRYCSLDCSKAKKELGWEPKIDIEKGLESTLEYFNSMSKESPSKP